jgi:hypothetical protein
MSTDVNSGDKITNVTAAVDKSLHRLHKCTLSHYQIHVHSNMAIKNLSQMEVKLEY